MKISMNVTGSGLIRALKWQRETLMENKRPPAKSDVGRRRKAGQIHMEIPDFGRAIRGPNRQSTLVQRRALARAIARQQRAEQ